MQQHTPPYQVHQDHGLDLGAITAESIFVPVLPLLEDREADGAAATGGGGGGAPAVAGAGAGVVACLQPLPGQVGSALLASTDTNSFLAEEVRGLLSKHDTLAKVRGGKVLGVVGCRWVVLDALVPVLDRCGCC